MSIFLKVIKTVFGSKSDKDLKALEPYVEEINKNYASLSNLSDEEIKNKFIGLRSNFHNLINQNKSDFKKQNIDDDLIDDKLYKLEKEYLDDHMVEVYSQGCFKKIMQ